MTKSRIISHNTFSEDLNSQSLFVGVVNNFLFQRDVKALFCNVVRVQIRYNYKFKYDLEMNRSVAFIISMTSLVIMKT